MDEQGFRELYLLMRADVFTFAARRLGSDRANEVVSATFEVVWTKRDAGPDDPGEWPAWVIGIAKNKVLQEAQRPQRKHHDNRFVADHEKQVGRLGTEDPERRVVDSDAAVRIYRELTPAERQLFDIAWVRSIDKEQAAALLGISLTAYSTRLTRLRQRIASLHVLDAPTGQEAGERYGA